MNQTMNDRSVLTSFSTPLASQTGEAPLGGLRPTAFARACGA